MIKRIYTKVCTLLSEYLGRIFILLIVLDIISGFNSATALNAMYKEQKKLEGLAQTISTRLLYRDDIESWDKYLEGYKNSNRVLYEGTTFEEVLDLLSDIEHFTDKDSNINELQSQILDEVSVKSKYAILSGALSRIIEVITFLIGGAFLIRALNRKLTKEQRFRKRLLNNWEEDFSNNINIEE